MTAALVGASYGLCTWEVTQTCFYEDDAVDEIDFENGTVTLYADEVWYAPDITTVNLGGYGRTSTSNPICTGAARFTNPVTSAVETISWWEAGRWSGSPYDRRGTKPSGGTC